MMNPIGRIYYFCPDHATPSGGIKKLYHHVKILNEAGFDASVLHVKVGFHSDWHGYDVPVEHIAAGVMIEEKDVLVVPESQPDLIEQTQSLPCTRIVFAQSWVHIYPNLNKGKTWKDFDIRHVITQSGFIQDAVQWGMDLPVFRIAFSIDHSLFYPRENKKLQVIFLSKKDTDSRMVEKILKAKHPHWKDIEWIGVRDLSEHGYARLLRESEIFLLTNTREGLNIAGLEAMASGCIVVGYDGVGGMEYMIGEGDEQNCMLIDNGDYITLARKLEKAIQGILDSGTEIESIRKNAIKSASSYLEAEEKRSVLDFWKTVGKDIRITGDKKPVFLHLDPTDHAENRDAGSETGKSHTGGGYGGKTALEYVCSIVIPVFNQLAYTKKCLSALIENTGGLKYEVIIVDNGSDDGTVEFCKCLAGDVKIIRNEENLGFAAACNQGASAATGRYLVFLNNDTIPQKGWLSAMTELADEDDTIGIVGSKLIFPESGKIQHAGVVISKRNNTPYNLYQNFPPDHPAVNRLRDFKAVTGACLLIRRSTFMEVSGFDEAYRNCFEDVDLCLKVREKGLRVVYHPASVLYHYQGMTDGRKAYVDDSTAVFFQKWGEKIEPDEDAYYREDGFRVVYSTDRAARVIPLENEGSPNLA